MGQIQPSNDTTLAVQLKRSRQARRLSLRVSSVDGRITLTMPPHVSDATARRFIEEKADWISKAVEHCHSPVQVRIGSAIPIGGQSCPIVARKGRAARLTEGRIEAPEGREGPAIEALVKQLARDRLSVAVARFAEELGKTPGRLSLRDTRSRWGSCSSDGNLMFSWRLVFAPIEVLDYVAAHEVAHLEHMNHAPVFWQTVARLYPSFDQSRAWLRKEGSGLHRYRFRETV